MKKKSNHAMHLGKIHEGHDYKTHGHNSNIDIQTRVSAAV